MVTAYHCMLDMRYEMTNKRNLHYSLRYRQYDNRFYVSDVDYMHYKKNGQVICLIETKFGYVRQVDTNDSQFDAYCWLADERIPVFMAIYYPMDVNGKLVDADQPHSDVVHMQLVCCGVNKLGQSILGQPYRFTEEKWFNFLSSLYGLPNTSAMVKLSNTWLPVNLPEITMRRI